MNSSEDSALKRLSLMLLTGLVAVSCSSDTDPAPADADGSSQLPGDVTPDADVTDGSGTDAADAESPEVGIQFGASGPLSGSAGIGSFRFGAATAAAQIEDGLNRNDWHFWTEPEGSGGLGNSVPIGPSVLGFTRAVDDIALMTELGLDAYRFSVDWSRIEPERDVINQAGIDHYDGFVDALIAAEIEPMITVHHFSNPIWVDDVLQSRCDNGASPSDTNLCGWSHPIGGPLVAEELAEHAALLAREYGDRVDDWCTLNEPVNYLIASYGVNVFPPGRNLLLTSFPDLIEAFRNFLQAHALVYDAIRANDTVDANGDGVAAHIGLSLSVVNWQPAFQNQLSTRAEDIAARDRVWYVYHHLIPDALATGSFDSDLDGSGDEAHPDWQGRLDWLGIQYYFRSGVTSDPDLIPGVNAMICFGDAFDFGACLPPLDESKWVPSMRYEFEETGMYDILMDMHTRYPETPLVVTEAGIAAVNGVRRAQNIVRILEQTARAMGDGADIRGYYHWSLMDNFEWAEGYEPRFGLYHVERSNNFERVPTDGATVYGEIIRERALLPAMLDEYGGTGPMAPEISEEE
jgi:beta-glucosidase